MLILHVKPTFSSKYEKFNQKRKEENLLKAEKEDEEILESTYKALRKGKANE